VITEHALIHVTEGQKSAFESGLASALAIITSAPGCHRAEVRRQHEDPNQYLLLVEWDNVEAHMAFRESELFAPWKELTWVFYDQPSQVTHFFHPFITYP
jgi:heme-degrading monooxygenase HmoA